MKARYLHLLLILAGACATAVLAQKPADKRYAEPINIEPPHINSDKSVKYDFDIVYVRAPRPGGKWAEVGDPRSMQPCSDQMLLRPDGAEEVPVPVPKPSRRSR
jgi:hypothetical protein